MSMLEFLRSLLNPDRVADLVVAFTPRVAGAVLIFTVFWLIQRLSTQALTHLLRRAGIDDSLIRLLVDNLFRFAVILIGVVMAAGQLGINVTAALAGISVAGLAVGFAAQDSLANMIAGFMIFWDKPFSVGDYLTVQGAYGRVVEITMRTTRIRTQDNTYVVIPNKHIADTILTNHTKHGDIRVNVPVGIAYKEQIPEARRVLLAAVRRLDGVSAAPAPDVVVAELGGSSVNLLVRVWVDRPELERPTFYAALEASKLALDAAGIQIPFPHLQLFLEDVDKRVWERLGGMSPGRQPG